MNNKIICDVANCAYNSNKQCSASQVKVANDSMFKKQASKPTQTECATFMLK
jgi:Domain of Unknown Function (DUF1540).